MFLIIFVFFVSSLFSFFLFFFFNDTATTEIYTLSLHDALPISYQPTDRRPIASRNWRVFQRSEEHTSELQSHSDLVCRLLLEKKNKHNKQIYNNQPNKDRRSRIGSSHLK